MTTFTFKLKRTVNESTASVYMSKDNSLSCLTMNRWINKFPYAFLILGLRGSVGPSGFLLINTCYFPLTKILNQSSIVLGESRSCIILMSRLKNKAIFLDWMMAQIRQINLKATVFFWHGWEFPKKDFFGWTLKCLYHRCTDSTAYTLIMWYLHLLHQDNKAHLFRFILLFSFIDLIFPSIPSSTSSDWRIFII